MLSRVRREYAAGSKPFSSGRGSSRLVVPLSFASCNAARLESRRDRCLASLAEPTLGLRSKFNLRLVLDSDSPIPSALRECSHSPTSPVKRGSGIDLTFADSGEIGQTSGVHLGGAVVLSNSAKTAESEGRGSVRSARGPLGPGSPGCGSLFPNRDRSKVFRRASPRPAFGEMASHRRPS